MSLLKFILYSLIAFLVIRFVMRLISPPVRKRPDNYTNQNTTQSQQNSGSLDKPKYTIEAESVDYEIVEEPNKKNEE